MSRKKKLALNTIIGLVSQVVAFICGFIVPKAILVYYGSEVNGLVSSVTHFLSFISLAECGMGVVVQSSLYKPLAQSENEEISKIIVSSDRFFRKIGVLLSIYVIVLFVVYPRIVNTDYSFIYTGSLVLAIAISTFVQYYFCMSYRLLITADQKGYIQLLLQILTQIIIAILTIVMAKNGCSIQLLKLCTSFVLLLQPLLLVFYVRKNYSIDKKISFEGEPIKQKWNGLAQHIAYVVLGNTDTVVLSVLSTITNVSVYNIYYLVVNGIKTLLMSMTSGIQSLLGNMYAKGERETLEATFSFYEWCMHTVTTILFTCTAILIVPFVSVYTLGITDANYYVPVFGFLISFAQMSYCIRIPYNSMVFAAGHYKQTQNSAIIEAAINIVISVSAVFKLGLVGVAIGTLSAMIYRTVYLALYLRHNIINRDIKHFIKHCVVDLLIMTVSILLTKTFNVGTLNYYCWCILAIKVLVIVVLVSAVTNVIIYPGLTKSVFRKLRHRFYK